MQNDLDAIEAKMREQIDHHMSAYGDHAIEVMKFVPTLIAEVRALRTQLDAMRERAERAETSRDHWRHVAETPSAAQCRAERERDELASQRRCGSAG